MSKVKEKRERKIQEAAERQDWDEVSRLLDQPFENSLRKDRNYKTFSMSISISIKNRYVELEDILKTPMLDPLQTLLKKEERQHLIDALHQLTKVEMRIVMSRYFDNKSLAQIAREIGLSDKTVKKRLKAIEQRLKDTLK